MYAYTKKVAYTENAILILDNQKSLLQIRNIIANSIAVYIFN